MHIMKHQPKRVSFLYIKQIIIILENCMHLLCQSSVCSRKLQRWVNAGFKIGCYNLRVFVKDTRAGLGVNYSIFVPFPYNSIIKLIVVQDATFNG